MSFLNKDFVHCHVHGENSSFDGLCSVSKLVMKARQMNFRALSLTDHGNVGGWIKFIEQCEMMKDKKGGDIPYAPIKPILGCLLRGQKITTIDGVKNIEDIKIGDRVLTHRGRFQNVIKTMNRIHTGYFYDIYLSGSKNNKLTLTEEHPVFVRNNQGETKWEKPSNISFGYKTRKTGITRWNHYVCLPKIKSIGDITKIDLLDYLPDIFGSKNNHIYKSIKSNKYDSYNEWENIHRYLLIDEDFSYFLGLYTAEGSACRKKTNHNELNGQIVLSFHKKETRLIDFCLKFIKDRFDIQARVNKRKGIRRNCVDIYICCLPLAYLFSNLCGKGAKNKYVSSVIFSSCQKVKDSYLNGVLDGDGKDLNQPKNTRKNQNLKVSSIKLAWGIRHLLVNRGVWSTVIKIVSKMNDINKKYTSYCISYNPLRTYSRTMEDNNYIYKPILKITKKWGTKEVFNFSVENDQSYVSDFILHNCECYLARDHTVKDREKQPDGRKGNRHLILIAKNWEGYKNLSTLTSISWQNGYYMDPRIDLNLLEKYHNGIIVSSACLSSFINANLLHDRYDIAKKGCSLLKDIFKEDFFLEVMFHGINAEKYIIPDIFKLSRELGIKVISSNDCHYIEKSQASSHDVFLAMSTGKCVKDPHRLKFSYDQFYLKSAEEMGKIFGQTPEVLYNTVALAERVDSDEIRKNLFSGKMRLPHFDLPEGFTDPHQYLTQLAWDGMKKIGWDNSERHIKALKMELDDLKIAKENNNMDFATYFLIVRDYINYAKGNGWRTGGGRGSVYASVIARCVGITSGPDPIEYSLLWERFLGFSEINGKRVFARAGFPDIDTDFDDEHRGQVFQYLIRKYGKDFVANIRTYSALKLKSSIRRIGKAVDVADAFYKGQDAYISDNELKVSEIINSLPEQRGALLKINNSEGEEVIIKTIEDGYKYCPDFKYYLDKYPDIRKHAKNIEGLLSINGVHASGVVLSDVPLKELAPLVKPKDEEKTGLDVTQFAYEDLEKIGLIKFDILGLTTLSIIDKCLSLIKNNYSIDLNIDEISLDDQKTLDLYKTGKLKGIFQCETKPMQKVMMDVGVDRFYDIVAVIALFRPGPMVSIPEYVDRKHGNKPIDYFHPSIEKYVKPYLENTFGLLVFQEQLMQICNALAGFSIADGYIMIKAVGKKKQDLLNKFEKQFIDGCINHKVPNDVAKIYWDKFITPFAAYGFNLCLSGDTRVYDNNTNQYMTLENLCQDTVKRPIILSNFTLGDQEQDLLVDVFYTGKKELYEIELNNGTTIKSTLDHKFLCSDEKFYTLEEIIKGDLDILYE